MTRLSKLTVVAVFALMAGACSSAGDGVQQVPSPTNETGASGETLPPAEGTTGPSGPTETADPLPTEGEALDNPIPVGTGGETSKWDIFVVGYTADASEAIHAENMFNEKPKDGFHYEMVTLKFKRTGSGAADPYFQFQWALFGDTGQKFRTMDWEVLPNDVSNIGSLPMGTSATGNVAFMVPDGETPAAIWVSGAFFALS